MNSVRVGWVALVLVLVLTPQVVSAQDRLAYRGFVLESTVDSVVAASGASASDVKALHARPVLIQELEWRIPYTHSGSEVADPVRHILFSFCDNALYQVLVTYDRGRTEGLSNGDIIESLSEVYGAPVAAAARNRPLDAGPDTIVLAQWERAGSSLTLLRGLYGPDFQLLLTSTALSTRARGAIRDARRQDDVDAPRREQEQLKKDADAAAAAKEKIRLSNKAAFKP
jgi:hypothetical protein